MTESSNAYQAQVKFEALAGGTVTLPALKTINTGTVVLESDGAGSVLNVSALTSFTEANGWTNSTLQATNGGTVDDGSLASLSGVNLTSTGPPPSPPPSSRRTPADRSRSRRVTQLRRADVVQRQQHHGQRRRDGQPARGHQLHRQRRHTTTLEATGTGSTLTLANLASVTEAPTTTRPRSSSRPWPAAR